MPYILFAGKAITSTGNQIDFDEYDDLLFKSLIEMNEVYKAYKGIRSSIKTNPNPEDVLLAADDAYDAIIRFIDNTPETVIPKDIELLKKALNSFERTKNILWGRIREKEYDIKHSKIWEFFEKIINSIRNYISERLDQRRYQNALRTVNKILSDSLSFHNKFEDFVNDHNENVQKMNSMYKKHMNMQDSFLDMQDQYYNLELLYEQKKRDKKPITDSFLKKMKNDEDELYILYGKLMSFYDNLINEWEKIVKKHEDIMSQLRAFEKMAINAFDEELFITLGYRAHFFDILKKWKPLDIPIETKYLFENRLMHYVGVYNVEMVYFVDQVYSMFEDIKEDLIIYLDGYSKEHIDEYTKELEEISKYYG